VSHTRLEERREGCDDADTEDVVAPDREKVAVGLAASRKLQQQLEDSGFFDRIFEGLAPSPVGPTGG